MKKPTIVYTYTSFSSFVAKDYNIINGPYKVKKVLFNSQRKALLPLLFIKQLLYWVINFYKPILFVSRFSGYHTVIPSLLNKLFPNCKSIIILGGSDSNSFPSINYGNYSSKLYGLATSWSIKNTHALLPVSKNLIETVNTYSKEDPRSQGVKAFVKNLNVPFLEIHNGFDNKKFNYSSSQKRKPKSFVTISGGAHAQKIRKLKGIDLIIEAAKELSDHTFTIIGAEYKDSTLPSNISFIPYIKNTELPQFLSKHEFYFQISMSEGFPNALCEAMLCGCVPIVSNVGIMPEIIKDTGYILNHRDSDELVNLIINNCKYSNEQSLKARSRISTNYTLEIRAQKLLKALEHFYIN